MARIDKTVFLSYRRVDFHKAMCVWQNLNSNGFDAFIDYFAIPSGDWESNIFENIASRAHFAIILTPTALERCSQPEDMMRREMEFALERARNVVPLLFDGFQFGAPAIIDQLRDRLKRINALQAIDVPNSYFPSAMEKLRGSMFLSKAIDASITPASDKAREYAEIQKSGAMGEKMAEKQEPVIQPQSVEPANGVDLGAYAQALDRHADLLRKRGEVEDAIQYYSRAIQAKPDYAWAYHHRGNAYYDKKDYDAAIKDFTSAIECDPAFETAYFNRGLAHSAKKVFDKAIEDFSNSIRLDPNYARSFRCRGNARKAIEDFDGAIEDYTKVIELKPGDPNSYIDRSLLYETKGEFKLGIDDCSEAIKWDKDLPLVFRIRSRLKGKLGDKEGEFEDSRAEIEVHERLIKIQKPTQ